MTDEFGLRWAIKRSFVDYVLRMPDGQGAVGAGARPVGVNEVLYAPETTAHRTGPGGDAERMWTFLGDARFSGHFGMLSVRVANPRIVLVGGQAELDIADPSRADPDNRLHLVSFTLEQVSVEDGVERWAGTEVKLTQGGAEIFNEVYPPGELFEDLTMTLPAVEPE